MNFLILSVSDVIINCAFTTEKVMEKDHHDPKKLLCDLLDCLTTYYYIKST